MNRTKLKNYAPQARRDFIQAMTDRAAFYGLTPTKTEPVVERGDVAVIAGREHPRAVAKKRKLLEDRIQRHGFGPTMEALAYTWFNRLVAVRFMELHGYLDHGYRVLSHPEGKPTPEIVEQAEHVELPGLKKDAVIDLKLAGNKESALYRLLLTAQCNALHTAMPFLFERIDDETELLLPDNLLHSDSLIRKMVEEIEEEDWKEVEIIGWLYQFYILEKKDEVIGKLVASEDIPAATQLFTPNWIVKYLVQNTIGRQWVATYPTSTLLKKPTGEQDTHYFMQYYIDPAEQTPEVTAQLKALTAITLNPEDLTLLDPACGSGHILVEGYDLFKAIYTERGYNKREIPRLILQKNLFGLEIDDRAAQLAAFALMMKARADDRRIFDSGVKPNVVAFVDSQGMSAANLTDALNSPINKDDVPSEYLFPEVQDEKDGLFGKKALAEAGHVSKGDIASLVELFENAKTFGSLIVVPPKLVATLDEIEKRLNDVLKHGDLTHASAHVIKPLLQQAKLLAGNYDAVVANPPYMGGKYFAGKLKDFVASFYQEAKADLYACFIQRNLQFVKHNGAVGMITIPNWMFLYSFESIRSHLSANQTIDSFVHNGRGVFGSDFGSCSFILRNHSLPLYRGVFRRLFEKQGSVASNEELERRFLEAASYFASPNDFKKLPGGVIAYWISDQERAAFAASEHFTTVAQPRQGLATADDGRFLRLWHEVSIHRIKIDSENAKDALESGLKWFPFLKGGAFRKWHGNEEYIIDWENDGQRIKAFRPRAVVRNEEAYFQPGITWSLISISAPSFRLFGSGFIIGHKGPGIFSNSSVPHATILAYLNSCVVTGFLGILSPTVGFEIGQIQNLPFRNPGPKAGALALQLVQIHKDDWDSAEVSWAFQRSPLLAQVEATAVEAAYEALCDKRHSAIVAAKALEEENNSLFIRAFELQEQFSPQVSDDQITLTRPDRADEIKRLLSYSIGCMMGRYSLDKPALIYAHSGSQGFDPGQYKTFRADDDGIIPLLENDWGIRDDATSRSVEFVGVAWPKEYLEENLRFVADSLGTTTGEQPRDTIRRYLATGFYKHHLSMYKKRPIYWLFSSGKLRAFQCLVYLHRYNDGTLSRMRTEYVIPLQGQIASRIDQLDGDKAKATSTSHRKKLQKEQDDLKKQQAELLAFEEKLKHAADQKIALDLDDGVTVNYTKFGDLLFDIGAKQKSGGTGANSDDVEGGTDE